MLLEESLFLEQVALAISGKCESVHLNGAHVVLSEALKLGRHDQLRISGPGTISGNCHSLFQIGTACATHVALTLENVSLNHECIAEENRSIGAAVFVLGKARVELRKCHLTSLRGFGIWLKHEASMHMQNCEIGPVGRTGIACFNKAKCHVKETTIREALIHGVCVRGSTSLSLTNCQIIDCTVRALYVYENATLRMMGCSVRGTKNDEFPAVDIRIDVENSQMLDNDI